MLSFLKNVKKIHWVVSLIFLTLVLILLTRLCVIYHKKKINNLPGQENFNSQANIIKNDFETIELHSDPDIKLIKGFLTKEECDYIINLGEPHIKKSEVCGKFGSRPDKSRTSMTAHIGKKFLGKENSDPILTNVLRKSESYCGLPFKNIEPIQLVRYEPGQYFKPHYDYLDRKIDMYRENVERNGQRKYTFFVYLTDVPDNVGGTTYFPKLKTHFTGAKGDAIFWSNVDENGEDDKRMLHSGTELKKGKKYGLNIWVRDKEYLG